MKNSTPEGVTGPRTTLGVMSESIGPQLDRPRLPGPNYVQIDRDTVNYCVFLHYTQDDELGRSAPYNNTCFRTTEWDVAVSYANSRAHDIGGGPASLRLLDIWIESVIGPGFQMDRDASWSVTTDGDVWPLAERYDRPPKAREKPRFCVVEREGRGAAQPIKTRLTYAAAVQLLTETLDRRSARTALWINEGSTLRPWRTHQVTLPVRGRSEVVASPPHC